MKQLTKRQQELLLFIEDYLKLHGFPPSIREMADHMGIRSTNGVNDHLKALERKGFISRLQGFKSRAITLANREASSSVVDQSIIKIPVVGRVAAGVPVLSEENIESFISLDRSLLPDPKSFALRVHGDSMIGKGIFDGDIVFVRPQQSADSGQIVVALIDDQATVKTFRFSRGVIRFEPENPAMDSIVVRFTSSE